MFNEEEVHQQLETYVYRLNHCTSSITEDIELYYKAQGLLALFIDSLEDFSEIYDKYGIDLEVAYKKKLHEHIDGMIKSIDNDLDKEQIVYSVVSRIARKHLHK